MYRDDNVRLCTAGPGLAIRVICAADLYKEKDFSETAIILRLIVTFARANKQVKTLLLFLQVLMACYCRPKFCNIHVHVLRI